MPRLTPHPETCERCPNRYSKRGCPCWIGPEAGIFETNIETKEERLVTGCFYQVVVRLMSHVVRASNRPAAAVESFRNELVERLDMALAHRALSGPPPVVIEGEANGTPQK